MSSIPKLYETEDVPLEAKQIHLHFFIGGCDWYIAEYDGDDQFFGFAILNNDLEMAEWGYVSLNELKGIRVGGWLEVDNDLHWQPCPAIEVDKICEAQRWVRKEKGS
jgi:hypothetical protein